MIMGFREELERLINREEKADKIQKKIKERINSLKSQDDLENLSEDEERLYQVLEKLEGETLEFLSKETEKQNYLLEKNREFVNWYVESVREFSMLEDKFLSIDDGLKELFKIISDLDFEGEGKVNLWSLGWSENVLQPASKVLKILKDIEEKREKLLEDLNEKEEEFVVDKNFVKTQRKEISKLSGLIGNLEDENKQAVKIAENSQLRDNLGLKKEEMIELESNLNEIEELEEEFEDFEEKISDQKRALTLIEKREFAEFAGEFLNDTSLGSKLKNVLGFLGKEEHNVLKHLSTLEKLVQEDLVVNPELVGKQIEIVREVFKKSEMIAENLEDAKNIYIGKLLKNRKRQYAEERADYFKDEAISMTKRQFLKSIGRIWAIDAGINILLQKQANQDAFMNPRRLFETSNQQMIKNVLQGGPAKILILNTFFDGNKKYDEKAVLREIEAGLQELKGVRPQVQWVDIEPSLDRMLKTSGMNKDNFSDEKIRKMSNYTKDFREVVENNSVLGEVDADNSKASVVGQGKTDNLVSNIRSYVLDYLNDQQQELVMNYNVTKVFLGDFKLDEASGVSAYDAIGSGEWALAHRFNSQQETINLILHELGHKFSLPHTYSQDVMS